MRRLLALAITYAVTAGVLVWVAMSVSYVLTRGAT